MRNIITYVISTVLLIAQPVFANGRSGSNVQHVPNKTVATTGNQQNPTPSPVVKPADKPTSK